VNRYNRKKLVVEDPQAAAIRITGSFEAENVDAFARLLRQAFGLNVTEDGDEIKISS
jgi:transmembrane sensor